MKTSSLRILIAFPVLMMLERWAWNELLFWAGLPAHPLSQTPPIAAFVGSVTLNYQLLCVRWPRWFAPAPNTAVESIVK